MCVYIHIYIYIYILVLYIYIYIYIYYTYRRNLYTGGSILQNCRLAHQWPKKHSVTEPLVRTTFDPDWLRAAHVHPPGRSARSYQGHQHRLAVFELRNKATWADLPKWGGLKSASKNVFSLEAVSLLF